MDDLSIRSYILQNVEALQDPVHGPRYRVAATLKDGLYLPCVVIGSTARHLALARRRLTETKLEEGVLEAFVCLGGRVNVYDIASLTLSPFAISSTHMRNIGGETTMGWTEFYVVMDDDAEFTFGTSFNTEFFSMPSGYSASRVKKIKSATLGAPRQLKDLYREKPFFECFIRGI
jgi:hypothetical protein